MNIEGKLVKVFDLETGVSKAGKEWKKQSILIEQDTEYNKEVVVSFFGDNVNKIKAKTIGDIVSCNINLSSREYKGKWYHNIDGWTCNMSDVKAEIKDAFNEKYAGTTSDDLPF